MGFDLLKRPGTPKRKLIGRSPGYGSENWRVCRSGQLDLDGDRGAATAPGSARLDSTNPTLRR